MARFDDLKDLRVGVQTGTTGDETVSKLQGKNSTNIKRFESTPLALKELEAGGVDAVVADNGVVINYVANNAASKFKMVNDPAFVPEQYGIVVRKGNAELLAKVNQGLAAIRADGTYDRIHAKYLGAPPSQAARRRRPSPRRSARRAVGFADLRWDILVGYGPLFLQGLLMTLGYRRLYTGGLALGIVLGLVSSTSTARRRAPSRRWRGRCCAA